MSIQSELESVVENFENASAGLFEITGRYHSAFEQGQYFCAIAKPTKRMRLALGVDREIIVVASLYSDQQQRLVKFIKKEIEDSRGRYEGSIAIAIHFDQEGNSKIRNWGRDQSISIIPVNFRTPLSSSVDLERRISMELYTHDPFDVTGPVSDDANFYGRRDEAIDLARKLQKGQIRSCLGIRKVGKTSIINRIIKEIQSNYECYCVVIDCSRDDVFELNAAQLVNSLAGTIDAIRDSYISYSSIIPDNREMEMKIARDNLQNSILELENPLVFIFDEVDYITPGSPTRDGWRMDFNSFWRNLRSIYQECDRQSRPMSILIGGVSTYWFTVESIEGVENAALAFIPEEFLSPMPEGATVAMLKRLGRIAGLELDDESCKLVAQATGNMPYWSRKCCSYIHRNIPVPDRPCQIPQRRLQSLIEGFVSEEGAAIAEVALSHLFRVHPLLYAATESLHEGKPAEVSEPLRRALRRYGIVGADNQLSGAMLNRAFAALKKVEAKEKSASKIESRGVALNFDEWAEELATLGRRRNILERKLRELTINAMRFDLLPSGKILSLKSRISSVLPENRVNEMAHLSAEEIVSKFLWTDLYKLILKEWRLFERVFGDKAEFETNCKLINDRPDTHAKESDRADIAMYRRALQKIEERVAKLQ